MMMRTTIATIVLSLAVVLAGAALAEAQSPPGRTSPDATLEAARRMAESARNYNPPKKAPGFTLERYPEEEEPVMFLPLVYALVGLAGIAVVGFKNPKRTHLD